jgi:hypothetical protein
LRFHVEVMAGGVRVIASAPGGDRAVPDRICAVPQKAAG